MVSYGQVFSLVKRERTVRSTYGKSLEIIPVHFCLLYIYTYNGIE